MQMSAKSGKIQANPLGAVNAKRVLTDTFGVSEGAAMRNHSIPFDVANSHRNEVAARCCRPVRHTRRDRTRGISSCLEAA